MARFLEVGYLSVFRVSLKRKPLEDHLTSRMWCRRRFVRSLICEFDSMLLVPKSKLA